MREEKEEKQEKKRRRRRKRNCGHRRNSDGRSNLT